MTGSLSRMAGPLRLSGILKRSPSAIAIQDMSGYYLKLSTVTGTVEDDHIELLARLVPILLIQPPSVKQRANS